MHVTNTTPADAASNAPIWAFAREEDALRHSKENAMKSAGVFTWRYFADTILRCIGVRIPLAFLKINCRSSTTNR